MNHVWIVGTFAGTDAAEAPGWAIDAFAGATFRHFRSPKTAAAWSGDVADAVLVIQHRPREFAASEIAALIASQPLAQFIVGLGAWCGSSARSEVAWPDSIAVPLWELPGALCRIAFALEQGDPPAPWQTSGRDEVLLAEREWIDESTGRLNGREGEAPARLDVVVESPDRVLAETLRDLVGELVTVEQTPAAARLTLWDADPLQCRLPGLTELRRQRATDHIIAFVDQPTRSTVDRLRRAGADAVVAKPFRAAELRLAIDRLASASESDSDDRVG